MTLQMLKHLDIIDMYTMFPHTHIEKAKGIELMLHDALPNTSNTIY